MTIVWVVVWLICELAGSKAKLAFDPVNWWTGTFLAALALDVNRPPLPRRR